MLLVQEYLRSGKSLTDLQMEHGVYSFVQNGKICLNYDQIEARNSDPVSQECRGLILEEKTFNVAACPFFRFFNMEQKDVAAKIDWNSAEYFQKIDGTLGIVYFYQGKWQLGTRSRPEADVLISNCDLTFSQLADFAVRKMFKDDFKCLDHLMRMKNADIRKTYCFEITSPLNRVVCVYNDYTLTLLGVRDIDSLAEEDPVPWAALLGFPQPKAHSFGSVEEMVEIVKSWKPLEEDGEGVVIRDKHFNRIKVKNPAYVAYNKLNDSLASSFLGCLEIILLEQEDDILTIVPDFVAERIVNLKEAVQKLIATIEEDYQRLKDIEDMKSFALEAKQCLWPAPLFALKRNKTPSLKEFLLQGKVNGQVPRSRLKTILWFCVEMNPKLKPSVEDLEDLDE